MRFPEVIGWMVIVAGGSAAAVAIAWWAIDFSLRRLGNMKILLEALNLWRKEHRK